jgi:threonine/homoserine/homoserine lactone efflux protein
LDRTGDKSTTTEQIVAFVLFALVAAVTPGPSNIMLTAVGANAGLVHGLPCLLGVASGMGLMMFLVPLGLGSVVLRYPIALRALNWGGAAFLLWLSWKIATSSGTESATDRQSVGYFEAAGFQWINPKSWLVSASAAGTFLSAAAGSPVAQAVYLAGLFFLVALPSGFVWLAFGATVQRMLGSPRRLRTFNVVMGLLLAASIVLIVVI